MDLKFWRSTKRWEAQAPEQTPAPSRPEPLLCPMCGEELTFESQGVSAPTAINMIARCDVHGQVTPAEPPVMTLGPGAWGSSLPPPGSWRPPTQEAEPPRRRRPGPMAPLYVIRAPKPARKRMVEIPLDPRSYGND
jgi:hypothetical protein